MAYINFKEEAYATKNQLYKRKANNKNLFDNILKFKQLPQTYNPCIKYSFKVFYDEFFGKQDILYEDNFFNIENKDIICTKFIGCTFKNLKFKDCRFIGCVFDNCKFEGGGVSFENCSFVKEQSESKPSLNKYDNFSCHFINCNIYAKFLNCMLSFSIFEKCILKTTNFEQSSMNNTIIIYSNLDMIVFADCNLSGSKIVSTYIKDLDFKDKFQTKLDEKSFFDKIPIKLKTRDEYEGLYMTYQVLADKFKENSLNNNFGEYYYLCKKTQRKTLKIIPKLQSYLYCATCGYGERPEFSVYSSLIIILLFAILYLFLGVEIDNKTIIYDISTIKNISISKLLKDLNETLSLSIGAFGGVGIINCTPTEISYLLTNVEVLVGIVMMGLGIGALTRKVVR